jgi:hypothetical protein
VHLREALSHEVDRPDVKHQVVALVLRRQGSYAIPEIPETLGKTGAWCFAFDRDQADQRGSAAVRELVADNSLKNRFCFCRRFTGPRRHSDTSRSKRQQYKTRSKRQPWRLLLVHVRRTVAITCGAHIDEARRVVEHLQIQRADWCIALFCGLQHYPRLRLTAKTLLGPTAWPGLASRCLSTRGDTVCDRGAADTARL